MSEQRSDVSHWFRSSDEVRTGYISGETFKRKEVTYSVIDGMAIFEGDIILGTVEQMEGKALAPRGVGRPGSGYRWPGMTIPWQAKPALRPLVLRAIRHWEANTSIRFVERTPANQNRYPDYLSFKDEDGCWSSVGRQGGEQDVSLAVATFRAPAGVGNPMGYQGVGAARMVYRGQDNHVHEIWLSGSGWQHWDMTASLRAPLAAGDPMGYQATGVARVVYCGRDSHVHEIWLSATGWQHYDHTAALSAPLAAGEPMGYQSSGRDRVVYRGRDNHAHEIALAGTWRHEDLTPFAR
jgi:hypothetical protein